MDLTRVMPQLELYAKRHGYQMYELYLKIFNDMSGGLMLSNPISSEDDEQVFGFIGEEGLIENLQE